MEESTSKEKVLKKIRNALISRSDPPFSNVDMETPLYEQTDESPDVLFAQEFTSAGGMFVYCEDIKELVSSLKIIFEDLPDQNTFCQEEMIGEILQEAGVPFHSDPNDLPEARISITGCEFLIARLGSIMITSRQARGRRISVFPDSHVVIGFSAQLVPDLQQAFQRLKNKYGNKLPSLISVITGPSRTADIEKTLVMGAHGPRNLYLFYVDDQNLTR
jgi:L-lactate dehydrogenase complex protein LldG